MVQLMIIMIQFLNFLLDVVSKRLFYGIKKNGRYFFPGEPVYREIDITDKNTTSNTDNLGRFESYNLFIHTQKEEEKDKQYLFSISSYESLVELHDIESGEYHTVQTKTFYNERRIFSYQYSIFEIEKSNTFLLAVVLSCGNKTVDSKQKEFSSTNMIKKFQFNGFNSNNMYNELASKISPNNYNVRVISAIRIDPAEVICLLFVDSDKNLVIDFYNDDLVYQNKKYSICELLHLESEDGFGHFVKLLYLKDYYAVLAYFTDYWTTSSFKFRIVKYNNYNFEDHLTRNFSDFNFLEGLGYNGLFKLDDNRLVFTTVQDAEDRNLYFFVIDLYEEYSKMKIRRFNMKYPNQRFIKESSVSYYNGYITLAATIGDSEDEFPTGIKALLMIFGFGNGTDFEIDISPYLMDTGYYNKANNLFNRLMLNLTIDNNIFGYEKVYKIRLVKICPELLFYRGEYNKTQESNEFPLNDVFDENITLLQNKTIKKEENKLYTLEYQYFVKQPNYTIFKEMP